MIDAKLVKRTSSGGESGDRDIQYITYIFTVPNITGMSDVDVRLNLPPSLYLNRIGLSCGSPNFSIFFRDEKEEQAFPVYIKDGIDQRYKEDHLNLNIVNNDQPQVPYLYMKICNNDGVDTGVIWIELMLAQG